MSIAGDLSLLGLSDIEQATVSRLASRIYGHRGLMQVSDAYYRGEMPVRSLGISVPPELRNLRTVMGWPRVVVDAIDERLDVEGFRYSGAPDADDDLWAIWQANNLDEESQLGHLDALVYGRAFVAVGSGDADGDPPIITVESPLELTCDWDARTRTMDGAFRLYGDRTETKKWGTLYLPDQTVSLYQEGGEWEVVDRDEHHLGQVPIVRLQNRARTSDRHGKSEITPEVMSLTDAACRTLLGMEVSREFFAAPQRWMLGVAESAFKDPEGNPKTSWEAITGRVMALKGAVEGTQPVSVGQFPAGSPAAFTEVLDAYAKIMASITGLPSDYLGINTVLPASADAIRMGTDRLVNKVRRKQRAFDGAWESVMRLALLIRDNEVPDEAKSMETLWRNPEIPTPTATTQALFQQVQAGMVPATSDVVLEKLGYSAVERQRLTADRALNAGDELLAQLATSLQAREARTDLAVATDLGAPKTAPAPAPAPTPPAGG